MSIGKTIPKGEAAMAAIGGDGLTVREARPPDGAGIARAHVETWRSAYAGLLPTAYLLSLSEETAALRWTAAIVAARGVKDVRVAQSVFVAVDGADEVQGFATCGPARAGGDGAVAGLEGFAGEVYALYVRDGAQGLGAGRRLMGAMAERMLGAGVRSATVWCLANNPSRWFYERLGGARVAERPIRFAGSKMVECAYGWRDLEPLARLSADRSVR